MNELTDKNRAPEKTPSDLKELLHTWLLYDFETPKLKAEVAVDLLISEFVPAMIDHLEGSAQPEAAVLLAKEFPIPGYSGETGRVHSFASHPDRFNSPAVDYLVKKGKLLYLVELKTDTESFQDEQLFRMLMAKRIGSRELFAHYADVIQKSAQKKKYELQKGRLLEQCGLSRTADFPEELMQCEIRIVYLLLHPLREITYRSPEPVYRYTYFFPDRTDPERKRILGELTCSFKRIRNVNYDGYSGRASVPCPEGGETAAEEISLIDLMKYPGKGSRLWKDICEILRTEEND